MVSRFPGLDIFDRPEPQQQKLALEQPSKGVKAKGWETADGRFAVGKGALARAAEMLKADEGLRHMRQELLKLGVLDKTAEGLLRFTKDYIFKSPSRAAAILIGGNANGLLWWKDADGRTLKEIRSKEQIPDFEASVESLVPGSASRTML